MLARLQSFSSATICPLKCSLSAQLCTSSSSVICQLWLQCVSSAQMQTLSWAETLSINHNLSAQPQTVSSTALCQLECSLSANLYTISSSVVCQLQVEYVSLFQMQSVCLAAVIQLQFQVVDICSLSAQLQTWPVHHMFQSVRGGSCCICFCICDPSIK